MSDFEAAFSHTVGVEGGYANDPKDSGGATRWGITQAVARAYGFGGDIRTLPFNLAREIYLDRYWDYMRLSDVATIYPTLAKKLFDAGVNCGQAVAVKWLQAALNAFNQQGTAYADIAEDGGIGRITLYALSMFARARKAEGERVLFEAVDAQQGTHYLTLARTRATQEAFSFGWFSQRIGNFERT